MQGNQRQNRWRDRSRERGADVDRRHYEERSEDSLRMRKAAPSGKCRLSGAALLLLALAASAAMVLLILMEPGKSGAVLGSSSIPSRSTAPYMRSAPRIEPRQVAPKQKPPRKRYAFAITITKDGFFLDGAAVLAYSILKYSWQSDYSVSFIAFVHPNVTVARAGLANLGFHVIEVPVPINTSAIPFDFLREKINKNGCCGSAELIKLTSYRLLQYDRVIHLDADVILLNNLDSILQLNYSLIYTTDPNMATFKKKLENMPVQGGFLVLRPSDSDYRAIIHTEVTTEFRKYHGWNSSNIGWYWGGMTVQGVLPYYYYRVSNPNRTLIVDRCYYNTMADTEPCKVQTLDQLKSAHFTVCQKPWNCMKQHVNRLCKDLHERWLELRSEVEAFYGISDGRQSACKGPGLKNYRSLDVTRARLPTNGSLAKYRRNVIADDSPDRFDPVFPESGYLSNRFD